jgi:hypothetical protein
MAIRLSTWITAVLLCCSLTTSAQVCDSTLATKQSAKTIALKTGQGETIELSLIWMQPGTYHWDLFGPASYQVARATPVVLLFADGSEGKYKANLLDRTDGTWSISTALMHKPLKGIRLQHAKGKIDLTLSTTQSAYLREAFNCLKQNEH